MDAANWVAIIAPLSALVGSLGGFWLAGRNDEAKDGRATAREATARQQAMAERLEEQRHNFQRETLLELQDELQRLARVTAKVHLQDMKMLKEVGKTGQLPEELSADQNSITISVQRLRSRILNPELRQVVEEFVATCSQGTLISLECEDFTPEEVVALHDRHLREMGVKYQVLSDQLGEHLRQELDRRRLAVSG